MNFIRLAFFLIVASMSLSSCRSGKAVISEVPVLADVDSAFSTRLAPKFPPEYYIDQGVKYFLTMKSSVPARVQPQYSDLVIRWEWPPWLKLTGFRRRNLINTDILLKLYPTKYDTIDCQFFEAQPFCRCHVIFNYSGTRIPIYEEFAFNDLGQITFIEAWSDYPSLLPMNPSDYWAEADSVKRLSTRIPGLGSNEGRIDRKATWMLNAAEKDADLADMLHRVKRPVGTYISEYFRQRKAMKQAHHPPEGDSFPYR